MILCFKSSFIKMIILEDWTYRHTLARWFIAINLNFIRITETSKENWRIIQEIYWNANRFLKAVNAANQQR